MNSKQLIFKPIKMIQYHYKRTGNKCMDKCMQIVWQHKKIMLSYYVFFVILFPKNIIKTRYIDST